MTHETDFLDLYRRLGLHPGCSLDELKQAYRRHVAALHPDRRQGRAGGERAEARLQRLTSQYGAAMEFHRRHGRLPGAPRPVAGEARPPSIEARAVVDPFAGRSGMPFPLHWPREAAMPTTRPRPRRKLILLLVVAALATLGWMMHGTSAPSATGEGDDDASGSSAATSVPAESAAPGPVLRAGMSPDEVRAMEGEPVAMHGELWEYGPSWVRFDHGEVVEWHSSPLRPLHADTGTAAGHSQ